MHYVGSGQVQDVVIRTSTFTTKLSIDGYVDPSDYTKGDTIAHYGYSGLISVKKCALSSFDEYGAVGRLTANSQDAIGHIAIKNGATAYQVVEADGDNSFVTVDSNATVFKNDGTKVSGGVDTRSTDGHDDLFVTDADEDCEHSSTHIVSDGQYLYEVCDSCGYTVISVIDSTTGETKRNVVDSNGQETIVPMSTYTVDGTNVSIDANGRVVLGNNAEPTIATPAVDKNQPITHFEHNFGDMEIIKGATAEEKGLGKYVCTECGFSYTIDIPEIACEHSYQIVNNYWENKNGKYEFYEKSVCSKCGEEKIHQHDLVGMYCNTCKHMIPLVFDTVDLEEERIKDQNILDMAGQLSNLDFSVLPLGGGTSHVEKDTLSAKDLNYMACFDTGRMIGLINDDSRYVDNRDGTYSESTDGTLSADEIASQFDNYRVDFTLSFNTDIDLRCLMLAGYYNNMPFAIKPAYAENEKNVIEAGTEIPIIGNLFNVTYSFLRNVSFLCGLYIDPAAAVELTPSILQNFSESSVTLRLVMYEDGKYDDRIVVNTITVPLSKIVGLTNA